MPDSELLAQAAAGGIQLARYRCLPGDPAWGEPNHISHGHVVAFPHRAVGIHVQGRPQRVADPNRVLLYDPGSRYERHLIDPDGDHCTYIGIQPWLLATLDAPLVGVARRDPGFVTDTVGVDPTAVLRLRLLAAELREGVTDDLTVEERLLALALDVLRVPLVAESDHRADTVRAHRRLVEQARAWIGAHLDEQWRLDDLAATLAVAPAHLHRVFRARTGSSVHEHRDRLRLAIALDRVLDGAEDLSAVGLAVGYSSHSHFTRRFRRAYGTTPSRVRDGEAVRIVTATG